MHACTLVDRARSRTPNANDLGPLHLESTRTRTRTTAELLDVNQKAQMAVPDSRMLSRPVAIAPASVKTSSHNFGANHESALHMMPYTCQSCAKRKVKCDKTTPTCFTCRKGKLECVYRAPLPRRRKRQLSSDVDEKLARYERILHQHGLLPRDLDISSSVDETPPESAFFRSGKPDISETGKLLAGQGKSRYVGSSLWRHLGDDWMQQISDDEAEEEDHAAAGFAEGFISDPLTAAVMGHQQSLLEYHPTHAEAILLWKTHIENVEPICKVLHVPTTSKMVETVSQQPELASRVDECLLFATYHFAVFSMTEEECANAFGQLRATLMQRYHFATRQALVNASFLKTTEVSIMQALVLFLLPCQHFYDPHTFWILTGVAIRIAQRIGLHRDGEKLGLPPFDVQMRRRLFYQLIPLDGVASRMSGTGIAITPESWDTERPLNINDDQIWPGMTEPPAEQKGATEMIFCQARSCVGYFFAKTRKWMNDTTPDLPTDYDEVERMIKEIESEVEERFIRYCDMVNPLHFLTIGLARSAVTAMRLRARLPRVKNQTITDAERKELFQLSQNIIDTDTAASAHIGLRKYQWYMRPFFLWGSWDSLIFVLTSLNRPDLLSCAEIDAAWKRVEQAYNNHDELLEPKRALQVAIGRLTLKAWDAKGPDGGVSEPTFIITLRNLRKVNPQCGLTRQGSNAATIEATRNKEDLEGSGSGTDVNGSFGTLFDGMSPDIGNDVNPDSIDWILWDKLIRDYQAQGGQEQGGLA